MIRKIVCCKKKIFMVECLPVLFIGARAGAGKKNPRSRSKPDQLRKHGLILHSTFKILPKLSKNLKKSIIVVFLTRGSIESGKKAPYTSQHFPFS